LKGGSPSGEIGSPGKDFALREWLKALPLGLGLPAVIGAASVKPEDAASNLAAWAHFLGFEHTPAWLSNPAIDHRAIIGSLAVGAAYAFVVWGIPAIRRRRASAATGQAPLPAVAERLQILTGTEDDFETRRPAGLYMTDHTFSVCVENGNPTQFRSNCKLYLNIANQKDHGSKDYWLDGPFTLNPIEKRFRSIVSYLEPASVSQHTSDFIQLHIPIGQGYGVGYGWPWRLPLGAYAFTLWASCLEAGRTELACKIWGDDGHKLHFEKA
jgi:hypothetical protein